jgi:NADPH2:quinone reductase
MPSTPHIVGYQAAGLVRAVGDGVSGFTVGQPVVATMGAGSHAEIASVPAGAVYAVPDGLPLDEAAAIPIEFGTADDCLFEFGRLQAGETALIHAGASGVGIAAIQLAKRAGARVLATASGSERLERLTHLGLDQGIDYTAVDFVEAVREATDGRGADVIVDSVGGSNLQRSLHCLAYRGRCVSFGDAGRDVPAPLDITTMRGNNQTLVGYFLGAELFLGHRAHDLIAGHLDDLAAGRLQVVVDRTFPLEEAGEAHAYIESRQAFGRVLLIP